MCLAQGHNAVKPMRLEPATLRSQVKHSTTKRLPSLEKQIGKTLIGLLLQKQSDLGLHCLSRPFWQAASVLNFRTFTVLKNFLLQQTCKITQHAQR